MFQQRHNSSLLDLEAANYFELDPNQMNLFQRKSYQSGESSPSSTRKFSSNNAKNIKSSERIPQEQLQQQSKSNLKTVSKMSPGEANRSSSHKRAGQNQSKAVVADQIKMNKTKARSNAATKNSSSKRARGGDQTDLVQNSSLSVASQPSRGHRSPSTSTGSLPSITSSPSLSPSLVCPHLSLDDILSKHNDGGSRSAHTIGLCEKCLVCPPPDIHSPLSPAFRPSMAKRHVPHGGHPMGSHHHHHHHHHQSDQSPSNASNTHSQNCKFGQDMTPLRRGYSDQQIGLAKRGRSQVRTRNLGLAQDDSLDYYLAPEDLKRLQMSPTIRNSVEYIRNNTIESGRVVRIYKDGHPFDKPLRICILRGEFANLNQLLDHINSRQLIPSGARYLFHLDGQLVYSENELKHGSCYIVSGVRNFDFKVNSVLKEQQLMEQMKPISRQTSSLTAAARHDHGHEHRSRSQQLVAREMPTNLRGPKGATTTSPSNRVGSLGGTSKVMVAPTTSSILRRKISHEGLLPESISMVDATNDLPDSPRKPKLDPLNRAAIRGPSKREHSNKRAAAKPNFNNTRRQKLPAKQDFAARPSARGSEMMSSSNETLAPTRNHVEQSQPVSVVRAKSELSALPRPNKRKKNVTFVDTGRGSSPAINLQPPELVDSSKESDNSSSTQIRAETSPNEDAKVELETSEIGIQVSDSLEGFLIDLPIAIPISRKRESPEKMEAAGGSGLRGSQNKPNTGKHKHGKVLTIAERQLSSEEMGQLKDMDQGDHHNDSHKIQHVSITLASDNLDEEPVEIDPGPVDIISPDRTGTINIGQEPGGELESSATAATRTKLGQSDLSSRWQYPDDPERPGTSATPTERPVSQSEANETIHARVTTPTPSLSTMGDSNSLTVSYDYSHHQQRPDEQVSNAAAIASLPPKQRVPVMGKLCQGLDPPARNFELVWVNGFTVNDQYPANSIAAAADTSNTFSTDHQRSSNTKSPTAALTGLLTPAADTNKRQPVSQFKPSDRFHNWVHHSRHHDELIYPAGSLVVLWCRLTNQQRYYSGHTSNISAITLASLDDDLAASAQLGDPSDRTNNSSVHLWSLKTLETLRIVDDDHFKNRKIFSLKVRNTELDGCELSVGSRDDKSAWFYIFFLKLHGTTTTTTNKDQTKGSSKQSSPKRTPNQIVIKANKVLQVNQIPLLIARLSNVRREQPKLNQARKSSLTPSNVTDPFGNMMISFGRRHFQVWFVDRKRQNLTPMQSVQKNSNFVDMITRANCCARMSPSEFLVGDSIGNLVLMVIELHHRSSDNKSASGSPSRTALASNYKFSIDTWPLIDGKTTTLSTHAPITCITRISGSLFVTADSSCAVKFWKIQRSATDRGSQSREQPPVVPTQSSAVAAVAKDNTQSEPNDILCHQLGCIRLPRDLGFICTIILTKYSRGQPTIVEFYAISTSNAILFGSVHLKTETQASHPDSDTRLRDRAPISCNLSVIYEGHESPAMSLVAEPMPKKVRDKMEAATDDRFKQVGDYFTCSLDCKICRWSGKNLVWKSVLPSACASLAVHPIGFVLAIGSADGTVYILDKISGLLISYFPLTPVCINCLAYSRDGTLLAAGCANGSIFILPVYERGLKYKKVSILQSPHPVVSLQFSVDNKYILTSVIHGFYQELILWDMPNFRYMKDNAKLAADSIEWFDSICSGSEDVRAIWENANLSQTSDKSINNTTRSKFSARKLSMSSSNEPVSTSTIVNLSCHRLIRGKHQVANGDEGRDSENFVIASDTRGHIRLFRYPCSDIQQGFYETRVGSSAMSCCRFLALKESAPIEGAMFVSSSLDGSICLWSFC